MMFSNDIELFVFRLEFSHIVTYILTLSRMYLYNTFLNRRQTFHDVSYDIELFYHFVTHILTLSTTNLYNDSFTK